MVAVHVQEGGAYCLAPEQAQQHLQSVLAAVRSTGFAGRVLAAQLADVYLPSSAAERAAVEVPGLDMPQEAGAAAQAAEQAVGAAQHQGQEGYGTAGLAERRMLLQRLVQVRFSALHAYGFGFVCVEASERST